METKIYLVPDCKISGLRTRFEQIARRAARLGQEPPALVQHGTVVRVLSDDDQLAGDDVGTLRQYVFCSVSGDAPMVDGWEIVAILHHTDSGTIAACLPGRQLPAQYAGDVPGNCDHCGTSRNRKMTAVLVNAEGETKQVGLDCLADFTGRATPGDLAAAAEWLFEAHRLCAECDSDGGGWWASGYSVSGFLGVVASVIRTDGWMGRGRAREDNRVATADIALRLLDERRTGGKRVDVTAEDEAQAEAAIAYVRDMREAEQSGAKQVSDYEHNLGVAITSGLANNLTSGLIASAIAAHSHHQEEERKQALTANSDYVGVVGEKIMVVATLVGCTSFDGTFGRQSVLRFADPRGNVLVWITSCNVKVDAGACYRVMGTVKSHEEYRGVKQTKLLRCKIALEQDGKAGEK